MRVLLRDGTPVLIRPIVPADKALLVEGLSRLSPQSAYRRFLTFKTRLSEKQLQHLTDIDYNDHMAWIAVDPSEGAHRCLGVARYIRLSSDPTKAEVAVAVVDSHQGRGLGTLLLSRLWRSALAAGVEVFVAYLLGENGRLLRVLGELGADVWPEGGGVFRAELRLPKQLDCIPESEAGKSFRRAAEQLIQSLGSEGAAA